MHKREKDTVAPATISLTARVPPEMGGLRLDQAAAQLFPDYSRGRLQHWIQSGALQMDGAQVRQRAAVAAGALLTLEAEPESETAWGGEPMPLDILYEDDELLVINKPVGLVVHPGAGNTHGTLANALLHHRPALASVPRGGIVHRLDKDTSGLLVVAGTLAAHSSLVDQLQRKDVQRSYFAVVRGCPSGGGRIEAALGRHPRQRTRMAVVARGGKSAVTHYRIARRFRDFTALDVELETGRTHQIRVHMAHRGYPLLGDPVYGGRLRFPRGASERLNEALRDFRRQALHARQLRFQHPASGESCSFEAPLAEDLQALLVLLAEENGVARPGTA